MRLNKEISDVQHSLVFLLLECFTQCKNADYYAITDILKEIQGKAK